MKTELPAPAKHRRVWPWVVAYVVALAVLGFLAVTVDQTGNNENGVWAAFVAVLLVGGIFVWRMAFRKG